MVEVRGTASNRNPRDGLAGGIAQIKMVEGAGFEPAYACAGGVTIRCL